MNVKLIDFYADWCGPCKQQTPIVEEVEEEWKDNDTVHFEKVDVDEEQERADNYSISSIPTIVLLREFEDKDETEVYDRFIGVTQKETLQTAVEGAVEQD